MLMKKVASSPERHTLQKERYIERCKKRSLDPNPYYIKMFETICEQDESNLVDPEWQKYNLEYELRSTPWICDKVKSSDNYAQNLYAAMCNINFQKLEVIPILKDQHWGCSWRHAGGIVADMREQGDYIDWYCSGTGNPEDGYGLDHHVPKLNEDGRCYVPEGVVTEEVRKDLQKLGWIVIECDEEQ